MAARRAAVAIAAGARRPSSTWCRRACNRRRQPTRAPAPPASAHGCPRKAAVRSQNLEFRVHVRQGGLTVTVLDTDARVPLLPSVALSWQATTPTPDRGALRVLSRFESGNPRHPAVDIRGEDVAELLPLLRDRPRAARARPDAASLRRRAAQAPLRPRDGRRRHHRRQGHFRAPRRRPPLPAHRRWLVRGRARLAHRHQRGHRSPAGPSRVAGGAPSPVAQPDDRRARQRAHQLDHRWSPAGGR